ncbi:LysE family translocator [Salipiger mangrovisoli]|uniref:LysE family transporter n=1 Tax=Salipiger mangrovisoli TaxID=2865933 RepID=A0ABR9X1C7_9RHOB|nr:LysE family transporter [Salipiger mangrovisoli]MBE9637280.1 LysE family transporter [Salipiger mangrovisoli]
MDSLAILFLFGASLANAAAPGPCIVFTISRSSASGLRSGMCVTGGILAADAIMATISVLMVLASTTLPAGVDAALKATSIAVVAYVSLRMIFNSGRENPAWHREPPRLADFSLGFTLAAFSPFNLVFLIALLPQILPDRAMGALDAAIVIGVFVVASMLAQLVAVTSGAFLHRSLRRFGVWLERAGGLLIAAITIASLSASAIP